jgi:hypothetical protein
VNRDLTANESWCYVGLLTAAGCVGWALDRDAAVLGAAGLVFLILFAVNRD